MEDQAIEVQKGLPVTERKLPLKRPRNHKPPVPRWTLKLPEGVTHVYTLYVGVQRHTEDRSASACMEDMVHNILKHADSSQPIVDTFRVTDGYDAEGAKVWVLYWTNEADYTAMVERLNLSRLWQDLGPAKSAIGLWIERFVTPIERLETNYARLDHKPGVAQIPRCEQPSHGLTAYWGAGRDRLPASSHDSFDPPDDKETAFPVKTPSGIGERIFGTNYQNMCHIVRLRTLPRQSAC